MNATKLNNTNLNSPFFIANFKEIEQLIGKEVSEVYNYGNFEKSSITISPGSAIFENNYPCSSFRPFTMINKNYKFDFKSGTMTIEGRNKWARKITTKKFQFEKVGYKLNTTSIPEGYIWGNPKELI